MTLQRLFVLGLIVLFSSCLCQKNPVASFVGRLSINGLIADEESDSSRSFVSAPNMAHQNWSSSMSVSQGTITKRAGEPVPRRYGPVWDAAAGNCVFCPEQKLLELDAQTLLRRLTVNKMKTYMRGTAANLNNKCVFYSRGEDRIGTLSSPATFWACMNDKYSIWVSNVAPSIAIATPSNCHSKGLRLCDMVR